MGIRWDALLVREIAHELDARLARTRLRAVRLDGASRDVAFFFRELTLRWRLHPDQGSPTVHDPVEPGSDALRMAARVRRVYAPADERLLVIELLPARGRRDSTDIVVELLGNQWNCLVTEGQDRILRHVLHTRVGKRILRVGQAYERPAGSLRGGVDGTLTPEQWREIVLSETGTDRARSLVSKVAWTSPINVEALLPSSEEASTHVGYTLWSTLAGSNGNTTPVMLSLPKGDQPYPWPLPGTDHTPIASLLDGFARWEGEGGNTDQASPEVLVPSALIRSLGRARDLAERRVTSLTTELVGVEPPERLRSLGDLILARYADIPPGVAEATVVDFDGEPVTVELEVGKPPHVSAARYYSRAVKSERALSRLPELISRAQATASELLDLMNKALDGRATQEDIEAALPDGARVALQSGHETLPPYRRYTSSGGLEIRVGRGARHNDALTFRHSAPNDVWLHARHAAGAHVILRWQGPGNPPARDLEEAAILAALHSKARSAGSAPVDWTFRKYVRKPRGAAPGSVLPDRVKTIFVAPDPGVAEALGQGDPD